MIALATIPLTCWLCVLIVTPRKPHLGKEVEELVYSRLLGRQHLLRLVALIVTAMMFFIFVLALPTRIVPAREVFQVGQQACTHTLDRPLACYNLQRDGTWRQVPTDSASGRLTDVGTGSLTPNASPSNTNYPINS